MKKVTAIRLVLTGGILFITLIFQNCNFKGNQEKTVVKDTISYESKSTILPANQKDTCFHIIRKNETFYSLADYYYGTSKESDELEKLNPGIDHDNLKTGQKIKVPCIPK